MICSGCELFFCIKCARISENLYQCIMNSEMEDFRWSCRSCQATFPSLENITGVLKKIEIKQDNRMDKLED